LVQVWMQQHRLVDPSSLATMPARVHASDFAGLTPVHAAGKVLEGAPVNMFPRRCPLLPTSFHDAGLEATYVKARKPHIQKQARRLCHCCAFALVVQAVVLSPDPRHSKGEAVGIVVRILLVLLLLCSSLLLRFRAEVSSVSLCATLILCLPLLDHGRMCWLLGEAQTEPVGWVGENSPLNETQLVLPMLTVVISFLALVSVRVQICWVVSTLVPLVYLGFTLPLPERHFEDSLINRVTIGCTLGIICSTLLAGKAQYEILFREQFSKAEAAAQAMLRERLHLNTEFTGHSASWECQQTKDMLCSSNSDSTGSSDSLCLSLDCSTDDMGTMRSKMHDLTEELDQAKVELLACRYVSRIACTAVLKLAGSHIKDLQTQHWLRTRAVIECMDKAHRTAHCKRHRCHHQRSLSLSESSLQLAKESLRQQGRRRQSASHQGTGLSGISECSLNGGSSSSSSSDHACNNGSCIEGRGNGPNLHCFDGTWELVGEHPDVEDWLRRFEINGLCVTDGTGEGTQLTRTADHKLLLDGGVLQLDGERLCRIGKSGVKLEFQRTAIGRISDPSTSLIHCVLSHAHEMQKRTRPPVA